jgi:hypothetical protein
VRPGLPGRPASTRAGPRLTDEPRVGR